MTEEREERKKGSNRRRKKGNGRNRERKEIDKESQLVMRGKA